MEGIILFGEGCRTERGSVCDCSVNDAYYMPLVWHINKLLVLAPESEIKWCADLRQLSSVHQEVDVDKSSPFRVRARSGM